MFPWLSLHVSPACRENQAGSTSRITAGCWEYIPFPFPTSPVSHPLPIPHFPFPSSHPTLPGPACTSFPSGKRGQCFFRAGTRGWLETALKIHHQWVPGREFSLAGELLDLSIPKLPPDKECFILLPLPEQKFPNSSLYPLPSPCAIQNPWM